MMKVYRGEWTFEMGALDPDNPRIHRGGSFTCSEQFPSAEERENGMALFQKIIDDAKGSQ